MPKQVADNLFFNECGLRRCKCNPENARKALRRYGGTEDGEETRPAEVISIVGCPKLPCAI